MFKHRSQNQKGHGPHTFEKLAFGPHTFFDVLRIQSFQEITTNIMNFVANHTNNKSTYSPFIVFVQQ